MMTKTRTGCDSDSEPLSLVACSKTDAGAGALVRQSFAQRGERIESFWMVRSESML